MAHEWRSRNSHDVPLPSLPPLDAVIHNVATDGLIPTPTNSLGLVDVQALIKVVDETIVAEYDWPSDFNDVHHLQWPRSFYGYQFDEPVDRHQFRNLAINQIILPRTFHNWIHVVTAPPDVPSAEVCEYRIETERVVKALFSTAQISARLLRNKVISEQKLHERLMSNFDDFNREFENVSRLPVEFIPKEIEIRAPTTVEEMIQHAPLLGRIAVSQTVAVATRRIRQTNRAA